MGTSMLLRAPLSLIAILAVTACGESPTTNGSAEAELDPLAPRYLLMRSTVGTLIAGEIYLHEVDAAAHVDRVTAVSTDRYSAAYPSLVPGVEEGRLSVWGAAMTVVPEGDHTCLAIKGTDVCVADVFDSYESADLGRGTPYFVRFTRSLGTLTAGQRYLLQHEGGADTLSAVDIYRSIHTYPEIEPRRGGFSFWGAALYLRLVNGRVCVVQPGNESSGCIAEVLAPMALRAFPALRERLEMYRKGTDVNPGIVTALRQTRDAIVLGTDSPFVFTCPNNPALRPDYGAYRMLGRLLTSGSRLLPWISREHEYNELADELEITARLLIDRYSDGVTHTTYSDCFGPDELQTASMALNGMFSFHERTGSTAASTYIARLWNQLVPLFIEHGEAFKASGYAFSSLYPATIGLYLSAAASAGRVGVDSYVASFTDGMIAGLLYGQSTAGSPSERGGFTQVYGGWHHTPDDLRQDMGYNRYVVDGLLDTSRAVRCGAGNVHPYWAFTCENVPSNVYAAIAFINNLTTNIAGCGLETTPECFFNKTITADNRLLGQFGTADGAYLYYRAFNELRAYPVAMLVRDRDLSAKPIAEIEEDARLASERLFVNVFSNYSLDFFPERLRFELSGRIGDL